MISGSLLQKVLELLEIGKDFYDPNISRCQVSGYEHSLQAATRAEIEFVPPLLVVMALIHDVGRPIDEVNHGQAIARLVAGKVPNVIHDALWYHGEFQGRSPVEVGNVYYRQTWFRTAERLASWDSASFDPEFRPQTLEHFMPLLRSVFENS